uniref:Uncharacterized protein n=1 Tax=Hucho hucho TaxID=62062 RepID=A0A4W5MPF4_9TELE
MDRKCAFLSKTRTFLSDPKLLDCSVYFIVFTVQLYDSCVSLCCAKSAECSPSMVVHTSVPFGVKHLEEAKEQVEPIILVKLNKPLPGLPQPDNIKCQKWRYSLRGWAGLEVRGHRTSVWEATSLGVPEHGPRPTGTGWAMIEHTHTCTFVL